MGTIGIGLKITAWLKALARDIVTRCRGGEWQNLIDARWRQGSRVVVVCLTLVVPVTAMALFHVWVQHETLRLGYALTAEEERAAELNNHIRQLDVELAAEHAPTKLVATAQQLGLATPSPDQLWRDKGRADEPAGKAPAVAAGRNTQRPTLAEAPGAEHAQP